MKTVELNCLVTAVMILRMLTSFLFSPQKKSKWWLLEMVEFYDLKREGFLANRSLTFCLMSFVVILRSDEIIWYSAVTKIQGPIPT